MGLTCTFIGGSTLGFVFSLIFLGLGYETWPTIGLVGLTVVGINFMILGYRTK